MTLTTGGLAETMRSGLVGTIRMINTSGQFVYPAQTPHREYWLPPEQWQPKGEPGNHKGGSADCAFVAHVTPSKAIEALFSGSNREPAAIECQTAIHLAYYRSLLMIIGHSVFDTVFHSGLDLQMGTKTRPPSKVWYFTSRSLARRQNQIKSGDWVYFRNSSYYLTRHPGSEWQGENALMIGYNQNTKS